MEDLTNDLEKIDELKAVPEVCPVGTEPVSTPAEENGKREVGCVRAFPRVVKTGVRCTLVLSAAFFVLFMAGSMYPPGVSDNWLFTILRLLRFSAFLCCVFSLVALGFGVHRMVHNPGVRNAFVVLRYFLFALLGAILAMFSLLIVAMVGGN